MSNIVRDNLHSLDETFDILEHVLLGAVTVHVLHYALVLADDGVDAAIRDLTEASSDRSAGT